MDQTASDPGGPLCCHITALSAVSPAQYHLLNHREERESDFGDFEAILSDLEAIATGILFFI